ncbi:MAG: hypothetical protein WC863_02600 [Patescibacteria group bacterium]
MSDTFQSFSDIIKNKKNCPAPAYPWQDLALRVIKELSIPGFKRSAIFKVCKEKTSQQIEIALTDTKELCLSGSKWQYFFKIIDQKK